MGSRISEDIVKKKRLGKSTHGLKIVKVYVRKDKQQAKEC